MRYFQSFTLLLPVALLAGCSSNSTSPDTTLVAGRALHGSVHGGQQPVVGAHIYLLAASTAGYGSASTSLLTSGVAGTDSVGGYVLTDSSGGFNITGDYTCTPAQQVYVYAAGGNPGAGANPAATFLAAVGTCPAAGNFLATDPFIYVSELTTVAFSYAVAGFTVDPLHVASSNTVRALTGLSNAFAATANLLNGATTPAGNGTVPAGELNTLADILASCVNSDGSVIGPSHPSTCYTLFTDAPNGSTVPADTATAAINIAHNPTSNVAALFNLKAAAPPYQPVLAQAPNDFTVAISYTGAGLATSNVESSDTTHFVNNIAVDSTGNIWKSTYEANTLAQFSPLGAPLSGSAGFTAGGVSRPVNVAVDLNDNVWSVNNGASTVSELSSTGQAATGSPFAVSINTRNVAIDGTGAVWVANYATVSKLTSAGAAASGSPFSAAINDLRGLAISPSGSVWYTGNSTTSIFALTNAGATATGSPYSSGLASPDGFAFDNNGFAWIASPTGVTKSLGANGQATFPTPSATTPAAVALDGAGNVWVTDRQSKTLLELNNTGALLSGAVGLQLGQTAVPKAVAVDGSGNVWYSTANQAAIYELVGAGTPVVTPISYGLQTNTLATRP